jgi:hypothetical protein
VGDHLSLDDLVAGGGPRVEGRADLCMSEDIWIAAPADLLGAGTESVVVKSGRDFPVGKGKGLGCGKGIQSEAAQQGRVLLKGGLLVGGEGREEGEMAGDEHLRDTGGLGGEWDCVIRWEAKDGRKKAVSSFIRGSARMRRDLGMGEDTETSQADREGDDGSVGGKRAGRRAESEDSMLEKGVQLMPNLGLLRGSMIVIVSR